MGAEIARAKNPGRLSEFRDSGYGLSDRHYLILHNVGGCAQVPTLIASAPGRRPVNILPKWNYFDNILAPEDLKFRHGVNAREAGKDTLRFGVPVCFLQDWP